MALRAIWQFMDRDVTHKILYGPKLAFGLKCHELFVILYSLQANLSDDMFLLLYI